MHWPIHGRSISFIVTAFACVALAQMAATGGSAGDASVPSTMQAAIAEEGELKIVDRPVPSPGPGQVLLKVHATAINRADTLQRKGKYSPPPGTTDILGLEAAGEVVAVGERLPEDDQAGVHKWTAGDRAMALLTGGGYAQYVVAEQALLLPVPSSFTWQQAAAVPEVWLTAHQLLRFVAQVPAPDSESKSSTGSDVPSLAPPSSPDVLVHAAGSGVGTAALQLIRAVIKGRAVAVAGSAAKLEYAAGLGAIAGINYKENPAFGEAVRAATGGKGADVILDCVGGSHAEQNGVALAAEGTWVVYGLMGGAVPMTARKGGKGPGNSSAVPVGGQGEGEPGEAPVPAPMLAAILRKRARVLGTTLRARSRGYKAALVRSFWAEAGPGLEAGELVPVVGRVFGAQIDDEGKEAGEEVKERVGGVTSEEAGPGLQHLAEAHRYVESNASLGKVVVMVTEG